MGKRRYRITDLGAPISCSTFLDERFTYVEGKLTLYSTGSGNPCVLNRYNLDDDRLEDVVELPGSQNCWSHGIDSQGRLYIAPQDKAKLFRYTPKTRLLVDLGPILGETAAYQISFDEQDRVYLGTFPKGMVVCYNPENGEFTSYGTLAEGHSYVHSLFYDRGFLYAGTAGRGAKLFRLNVETGEKKEIPLPSRLQPELAENLYTLTQVGRLAFAYLFYNGGRRLLIYDLERETWLEEEAEGFGGLYVSPMVNGKIYFSVEEIFWSFDPETRRFENTGLPAPAQGKGYGCIRPAGADHDILVTLNHGGLILMYVDFVTGQIRRLPMRERLRGGKLTLTTVEQGPGGELYLGAYMGSRGAAYNLNTGDFRSFALDQAEGMARADGQMYFGVYPGGRIYRYDALAKPEHPELIHTIGEEQDRPFAMRYEGETLYLGTIPGYNRLGGAVTVYNTVKEEWRVFRNLIPNQSICGLELRNGLLYGATSIWGGLGIQPTEREAELFRWGIKAERVLQRVVPDIPELGGPPDKLGGLSFGPDGLLWCVGRNLRRAAVFAVEPESLAVVKAIALDCRKALNPWRPNYICWGANGMLYTNVDGVLELNTATLETHFLTDEQAGQLVLAEDGCLYYGTGPFLRRIEWTELAEEE